jgi:hypothetical protein
MPDFLGELMAPSTSQDGPGWEDAPFLARLTSRTAGSGAQANLQLYGFIEQAFDPTTGFPVDVAGGRGGGANPPYALEIDNQTLTVPGSTPPGFTNAGPYVWMRLKGFVNGAPVYEFAAPASSSSSGGVELIAGNGSTIIDAGMTALQLDSAGVITAINQGPTLPHLDILSVSEAGPSQSGVVNHNLASTQQFAGAKKFLGQVEFAGTSGDTVKIDGDAAWVDGSGNSMDMVCFSGTFTETFTNASVVSSSLTWNNDTTVTYAGPCWFANTDLAVGPSGNIGLTSTTKFLYIPTCSGTPTGVPSRAGSSVFNYRAALVYDVTNDHLFIYNPVSGLWKQH